MLALIYKNMNIVGVINKTERNANVLSFILFAPTFSFLYVSIHCTGFSQSSTPCLILGRRHFFQSVRSLSLNPKAKQSIQAPGYTSEVTEPCQGEEYIHVFRNNSSGIANSREKILSSQLEISGFRPSCCSPKNITAYISSLDPELSEN